MNKKNQLYNHYMTFIGYYHPRLFTTILSPMCTYHMEMLDLCKSVFVFLEMLYIYIIYSFMFIFSFFDCYIPFHKKLTLCIIWSCARYAKNCCGKGLMLACMSVIEIVLYQHG